MASKSGETGRIDETGGDGSPSDGGSSTTDSGADPTGPSKGQRRLMYYLFAVAALVFTIGVGAIWALTYGPLG